MLRRWSIADSDHNHCQRVTALSVSYFVIGLLQQLLIGGIQSQALRKTGRTTTDVRFVGLKDLDTEFCV